MGRERILRIARWVGVVLIAAPSLANGAQPNIYQFRVDRAAGTVNGQDFPAFSFSDPFDGADGGPPPNAPNVQVFNPPPTGTVTTPINYFVYPAGAFDGETESGKLPLGGVLGSNAFGGFIQHAFLQTTVSSNPADALRGLRNFAAFTVQGTFDLVNPGPGVGYGIAVTDLLSNSGGDDILSYTVREGGAGSLIARFARAGTPLTLISLLPLDTQGHPFITLRLSHAANSPLIMASLSYDGTTFVALPDPTGLATIFHGENYTRGEFFLSSPVPEPGTYAYLLGGLALLGYIVRRRTR